MRGERRAGGGRGDAERDLGGRGASLHGHRDVGAAGGRRRVGGDEQILGGDPDRHDRARDGNRSRDLARIVNPPVSVHLLLVGGEHALQAGGRRADDTHRQGRTERLGRGLAGAAADPLGQGLAGCAGAGGGGCVSPGGRAARPSAAGEQRAPRQDGEAANDPAAASYSPRNHEHHIKSSGPTDLGRVLQVIQLADHSACRPPAGRAPGCVVVVPPIVPEIPDPRDRGPSPPPSGVSPSARRAGYDLESDKSHGEVRMSTYDKIAWLPLCGGLTGLGLVLSYLAMRRRGIGAGLRGAAWSLLPIAAYLTGSIEMFWKMGVAIGDF